MSKTRTKGVDFVTPRGAEGQMRDGHTVSRRLTVKSVVAGVACGVLAVGIGIVLLVSQPPEWRAEAALVVVPERGLDPALAAGYYETLSRGQVLATFAQTLAMPRYAAEATEEVGSQAAQDTSVEVDLVPETALIRVSAVGPDAVAAEGIIDAILGAWGRDISNLRMPYVASVVSPATGSAERSTAAGIELIAIVVFVGAVAGLAVQQAVYHVGMVRVGTVAATKPRTWE